jgi:hypothetical protein
VLGRVQLRAGASANVSPDDEDLPILQQRRHVACPGDVHAASGRPSTRGGVVQLRLGETAVRVVNTSSDQHFPVGEQRRRVALAGVVQTASGRPFAGGGIVQLRLGEKSPGADLVASSEQYLAVLQHRLGEEAVAGNDQTAGGRPFAGGGGV